MMILKLTTAVALVLSFSGPAFAGDDAAYCKALAEKYKYFYVKDGGHYRNSGPIDGNIAADQCLSGNVAGIPVLERKLRDAKVDLPARG